MTLDPRERKSWQGFLDLLQPPRRLSPVGGRLGSSFGLSIDAFTAALLTMSDTDGEALAGEPVAGVMAITRLRSKVRVLVHPGTISGSPHAGSRRFVALLDRMVVEVQADTGCVPSEGVGASVRPGRRRACGAARDTGAGGCRQPQPVDVDVL